MEIWYVLVLLLMVPVGLLFAAGEEVDVVYLKDGNVLRGTSVERQTYPTEQIILRTGDGLELEIPMSKIERITREPVEGEWVAAAATVVASTPNRSLELTPGANSAVWNCCTHPWAHMGRRRSSTLR